MAGTDDTAGCQHVQHGSFLALLLALHSAQLHVLDQRSDDVHLLFLLDEIRCFQSSPRASPKSPRTLALSTPGKQPIGLRLNVPAKYKMILMGTAEGAGVIR
jgi:hypothetical protein